MMQQYGTMYNYMYQSSLSDFYIAVVCYEDTNMHTSISYTATTQPNLQLLLKFSINFCAVYECMLSIYGFIN